MNFTSSNAMVYLFCLAFLFSVPEKSFAQYPSCTKGEPNYVCINTSLSYKMGLCAAPSSPTYCMCDKNESGMVNNIVICHDVAKNQMFGKMGATKKHLEIKPEEFKNTPMEIVFNPYPGSPGCTVSSGKFPLVLNANTPVQTVEMRNQGSKSSKSRKVSKQKGMLSICKDNCPKPVQWIFLPLENNNPAAGLHIQHPEKKNQYLQWTKEKGLVFVPKSNEMTEEEWQAVIWRVGALKNEKGETIGYRIAPSLSGVHALAVNNKTGEVAIKEIFTLEKELDMQKEKLPTFAVNLEYNSVWQFDNCKPLPEKEKDDKVKKPHIPKEEQKKGRAIRH